jgi:hypothetical protein
MRKISREDLPYRVSPLNRLPSRPVRNSQLLAAVKTLRAYFDRIERFPKLSQPIPTYREYRAIQRILNLHLTRETSVSQQIETYINRDIYANKTSGTLLYTK